VFYNTHNTERERERKRKETSCRFQQSFEQDDLFHDIPYVIWTFKPYAVKNMAITTSLEN